jgi:pimeloyl-ACP methyl ester carboxylesterase
VPETVVGMATHALAFLDGLGIERCDVLGFSLGGMVAQPLATLQRSRASGLRNSVHADDYLKVHHLGAHEADVTEGSGGTWERLHYDWSDPNRVVMTTTDSNAWGARSGHTYTFTPRPDGTTVVDAVLVREGKNLKGRLLEIVLGTVGKGVLESAFNKTVKAIEARKTQFSAVTIG